MFVVYEGSPRWVPAMRWSGARYGLRVDQADSWQDCQRRLQAATARVVGLEVRPQNLAEVVGAILRWRDRFPHVCVIVFGSRELRDAGALLYEAGAVYVVESMRNLDATARLVKRLSERSVYDERNYRQRVLDALPW